ncbi:MAG: EAL domain-containing protein [Gammaproteobacteria bacterium]|nr:EAL domain-containing protein [Gammaproteobacteria bacterium]
MSYKRHTTIYNPVLFVGIFVLLVGLLLAAIAIQRIDTYHEYHKTLADNTVSLVSNEINQLIGEKRRLLYLFTNYEKTLIKRMIEEPENVEIANQLKEKVLSYFTDAFSFTLADSNGNPMLDDFENRIGEMCQQEIIDFTLELEHHPQIHPNLLQYHYDAMVQLESPTGYVFFVSFQTGSIQNLLRLSRRHKHRLVMLNTETPNLIEVTADGNRYELDLEDAILSLADQSRILAERQITGTHWRLVDIGDSGLVSEFATEVVEQTALIFIAFLFSSGIMLILILRGNRRRMIAELALRDAKAQLEVDILHRTQELRESKELAETTLSSISEGVITTNTMGIITSINHTAEKLLDRTQEMALGQELEEILQLSDEKTREPTVLPLNQRLNLNESKKLSSRPLILARGLKQQRVVQVSIAVISDQSGSFVGNVLVIRDITDTHRMNNQITWQATHDTLTGLINRIEFENRLQISIEHARSDQANHALMYIDLDQFKVVNDTCGHIAGDELLRQIANILTETARRNDMVARLGGDEFAILLEYCPSSQALTIAEDIRTTVRDHTFTWEDKPFSVGVSIGVVAFDESYNNLTEILSAADSACYAAKEAGRNRVHLYAEDDQAIEARYGEMQWVSRLRHALDEQRFVLFCQQIVDVQNLNVDKVYLEILLRLEDPDGQLAPPGAFIPAAERYGIMIELDRFVVREALIWLEHNPIDGFLSINLSAQSITDAVFVNELLDLIIASSFHPSNLLFEVTETATISNLNKARQFIEQLKAIGCLFALDDFGSGMSSFGYLKHLPVDFIKIDGEFVRDITSDPIDLSMVKAINEVAQNMGMKTIAEYVEDDHTLEMLRDIGVDYAQGFGIARPVSLEEIRPIKFWENRMDSAS